VPAVDLVEEAAVVAAAVVAKRLATTAARLVTSLATALATDWKVKTDRLSTRRGRSTVVASTAARWDTSVPSAPRKPETRRATTAETKVISPAIAQTRGLLLLFLEQLLPLLSPNILVIYIWDLLSLFLLRTLTSTG
jgi:hypothetical protein